MSRRRKRPGIVRQLRIIRRVWNPRGNRLDRAMAVERDRDLTRVQEVIAMRAYSRRRPKRFTPAPMRALAKVPVPILQLLPALCAAVLERAYVGLQVWR
jgi:hypothetical protein